MIVALPLLVLSLVLVAVTTPCAEPLEGVNTPLDIAPPVEDHKTPCGAFWGRTVAVQVEVAFAGIEMGLHATLTLATGGGGVVVCRNDVPVYPFAPLE